MQLSKEQCEGLDIASLFSQESAIASIEAMALNRVRAMGHPKMNFPHIINLSTGCGRNVPTKQQD